MFPSPLFITDDNGGFMSMGLVSPGTSAPYEIPAPGYLCQSGHIFEVVPPTPTFAS